MGGESSGGLREGRWIGCMARRSGSISARDIPSVDRLFITDFYTAIYAVRPVYMQHISPSNATLCKPTPSPSSATHPASEPHTLFNHHIHLS